MKRIADNFNRWIHYLRVSVTDRCNLRCTYCMPEDQTFHPETNILSLEEIYDVVAYAVNQLGFTKIRLTGGEPLVRRNVTHLVKQIATLPGLKDFGMTTNGLLLPRYAQQLKDFGLHRVNISCDTLRPERYKKITRWGDLDTVLHAIDIALEVGLTPVKVNVVLMKGVNDDEIAAFRAFEKEKGVIVRFITEMSLSGGTWDIVEGDTGGGDCARCNRLRLTSDGHLRPCLFSDLDVSIRELGIEEAFRRVVAIKPEDGSYNSKLLMNQIGG